jgi:DNA adenine methylase
VSKEAPKIKAIAPWFGGKRTMAPLIVAELGKHTQYFEPFCGSMAVLFAKEPSQKETVNDLHCDLINLAHVIADEKMGAELYDRLQRALFSEALLEQARDKLADMPLTEREHTQTSQCLMEERAYWYFLASWFGRNGTAGTARVDYQLAVRWTKNGGSPTVRWNNAVESLPWWHRRLKNVVILSRDAFNIIDRLEDVKETAIYVDPPYHGNSRSGNQKNGRGGVYQHEFNHDNPLFGNDHARLAKILRGYRKARIVVSYYDCPEIRQLYEGWTFIDHTRRRHLPNMNTSYPRTDGAPSPGSKMKDAPEVLIINGPSYAKE